MAYMTPVHSVEVDSITGEVKNIHKFVGEGGMTWWDFFLQKVREQVNAAENEWINENSCG